MGLVLITPASYAVIKAVAAYMDQSTRMQATLRRSARMIAAHDAGALDKLRGTLDKVAQTQRSPVRNKERCSAELAETLSTADDFSWFAVADSRGTILCASTPALLSHSLRGQGWLDEIPAGSRFTVSELGRDLLASEGEAVMLAVPLGPGGNDRLAVVGSVSSTRFNAVPSTLELPEATLVYLLDARGQLLAATTTAISPSLRGGALGTLLRYPGDAITTEIVGEPRRLFVAEPILGGRMYVVVGLPNPRWSWLERDLIIGIFAPTLMLMVAIFAIWIATDLLINRHIRTLALTARAYSRGQLDASVNLKGAPTELRELGDTLSRMARRVQRREAELHASLEQKDILLKEIHHRVKNNLQIVTSLLNLRARALTTPSAREVMLEAQLRVRALALVHRNLYDQDDVAAVRFDALLGELCEMLRDLNPNGDKGGIKLDVHAAEIVIPTDQAIPLTLLVTEAVSNAFRHGFPDSGGGQIEVRLEMHQGEVRLSVADNGIGIEAGRARGVMQDSSGIGMTLIELLAKQVGGRLDISDDGGTRLTVSFPLEHNARALASVA